MKFSNQHWQLALVKSQTSVSVRQPANPLRTVSYLRSKQIAPIRGDRECRVIEHRSSPSSSLELSTSLYAVRRFVSDAIPARPSSSTLLLFPPMIFRPLFFFPRLTIVPSIALLLSRSTSWRHYYPQEQRWSSVTIASATAGDLITTRYVSG